jgi:arylsulfatase
MLDALEKLGVLDNTIVVYTTDNGPEHSARLHGGTTPFRGEKMTTYEGGVRVPLMIRWPGKIEPGTVLSGIQAHMDLYTTLAAAAGEPDIAAKVLKEQKQPIDGVNNLDYWTGKTDESARDNFIYYHESTVRAIRLNQWKLHFETSENYYAPYVKQKFPIFFNIRMDPFESFDGVTDRSDIVQAKQWLNEPVQHIMQEHVKSLKEYPPVQKAATLDFSAIMDQLMSGKQ